MGGPLKDILVVALEQAVAAPFCTSRLADAGARVIKVERADGDFARGYDHVAHGESAYFVWLNRGKESLVLDIKEEADRFILERMIDKADVFIQNLAPGAAARAGFGAEALRARNPRLICCDISGYGEEGPYRDMKAYDLLVQCETGLASVTGTPDGPGRVGVSIADIACGMYAHAAILQALYAREQTGEGAALSISLFDALADWMTVPLLHQEYGGKAPLRVGLNHPSIAPYGAYAAGDGRQAVLAIQNEREWRSFCAIVLKKDNLADDPRFSSNSARVANRPALDAEIKNVFRHLTLADVTGRLDEAKVAWGAVNSVADLSRHPQLRRVDVETGSGSVNLVAPPVRWRGEPFEARAVPDLGGDSERLRKEFG